MATKFRFRYTHRHCRLHRPNLRPQSHVTRSCQHGHRMMVHWSMTDHSTNDEGHLMVCQMTGTLTSWIADWHARAQHDTPQYRKLTTPSYPYQSCCRWVIVSTRYCAHAMDVTPSWWCVWSRACSRLHGHKSTQSTQQLLVMTACL